MAIIDPQAKEAAISYSKEHHLSYLMEHLMSRLLFEQPDSPRDFLIKELERLQTDDQYLFNFDHNDLEVLYHSLVQAPVPPPNLLEAALRELGCFTANDYEFIKDKSVTSAQEFVDIMLQLIRSKWC
ncbi:hypothetical protein P9112_011162 [Eukaryota sp. TZLM1-RC]